MNNLRSTLLTVLCILTFLVSSVNIVSSVKNLSDTENQSEIFINEIDKIEEKLLEDPQSTKKDKELIVKLMDGIVVNLEPRPFFNASILQLLVAIICLGGAVFMWALRKLGLWIYVSGNLIMSIGSFIVNVGPLKYSFCLAAIIMSMFTSFLYYTQRKYLVY
ncbi:MAG: hypothetical protein ACRCVT_12010 [Leadbetterella sp.]